MSFPEPRPAPVSFPFDAARRALDRIDELLEVLERIAGSHDEVTAIAPRTFAGSSRNAYEREVGLRLTDLATERTQLVHQHTQLTALVGRAERLVDQRARELNAWNQRRDEWNDRFSGGSVTPQ